MFEDKLKKFAELDKESERLYKDVEKTKRKISGMFKKYEQRHIKSQDEKIIKDEEKMWIIKENIYDEIKRALKDFAKKEFSKDLGSNAKELLEMIEEYSKIKNFITVDLGRESGALFEYFLKIKDVDSCIKFLMAMHTINEFYIYGKHCTYSKVVKIYSSKIGEFSLPDKKFWVDKDGFKDWKHSVELTPNAGFPREYQLYQLIKLTGEIDAHQSGGKLGLYYSEKSKRLIILSSLGGLSHITRPQDRYDYMREPRDWENMSFDRAEEYRYCLMRLHDEAYLKEKQLISSKEK